MILAFPPTTRRKVGGLFLFNFIRSNQKHKEMAEIDGSVQAMHLALRSVVLVAGFVKRGECNTLILLFCKYFLSQKGV